MGLAGRPSHCAAGLARYRTQRPSWNGQADVEAIGARATRTPPSGPALARSPRADGRGHPRSHRMSVERRRLTFALLLSLLIHALLLSLTFGGEGLGLPGFGFPWRERRIEAPDLRVLLLPAPATSAQPEGASVKEPLLQPSNRQPRPGGLVLTPSAAPAPTAGRTATAVTPKSEPTVRARPAVEARPEPKAGRAAPVIAPRRGESSGDTAPTPILAPDVIAMKRSEEATLVAPAAPPAPASEIAAVSGASSPEPLVQAPRDDASTAAGEHRRGGTGASR